MFWRPYNRAARSPGAETPPLDDHLIIAILRELRPHSAGVAGEAVS